MSDDEQEIVVQGKTLAEWEEEGRLNEEREEHVHPEYPEDREPTMEEELALVASLTKQEALHCYLQHALRDLTTEYWA